MARFGTPDPKRPVRLAELAAQIDGDLVGLYARHARPSSSPMPVRSTGALPSSSDRCALLSAADLGCRGGHPPRQCGERTALAAPAKTTTRLSAQCGGLHTPAVVESANPCR